MSCGEWDGAGGSRKHGNAGNVAVHVVCSNKSSDMERSSLSELYRSDSSFFAFPAVSQFDYLALCSGSF